MTALIVAVPRRRVLRWVARRVALYLVLSLGAAITLLPYVWMVSSSLKPESEIYTATVQFIPSRLEWGNYVYAWERENIGRYLLNSVIVATGETLGVLVTAVLAGYSFARLRFWGRDVLFLVVLGTMMIPTQVTLIPSFIIMKWLGWINTYQGLIVPRMVSAFGVFLMRQFFLSIPGELEDAARIDGCGRLRVLLQVMLPLVTPGLATLAIFTFNNSWNEFFWPLVVASAGDMRTIQVAISSFRGEDTNWAVIMATATLASVPVLVIYLALQRYFVKGIVMSGLKG